MPPRPCRAVLALTAAAALGLGPARAGAAAPEPAPKASKPAGKKTTGPADASKPDPKKPDAAKKTTGPADASKPDPKKSPAAKPGAVPKTSKTDPKKPDPKTSKTDPKKPDVQKSDPKKPDPKKPDPKKPDPKQPDPKASKPAEPAPKASKPADPPVPPASPAAPVPPASPAADGYWLAARLLGPPEAQAAAQRTLAADLGGSVDAAGMLGSRPTLADAVQWVARWAFDGPALSAPVTAPTDLPLAHGPAPIPGGRLYNDHGAVLHALTITGRSGDGGTRAIRWPQTAAEIVPPGLAWVSGVLLADRAPLFAAPAAHVPPAAERHVLVRRSGSLFILGHVDRCTTTSGERVCLRWAQVVARDGDDFHAGYLPAFQVARVDGWIRGAGQNPRVQLLAAGTVGKSAQFLLVARTRDGHLHRRTLLAPLVGGEAYPAARVRLDGEWATIDFTGAPPQRVAVDPSLDARVR